MQHTSGVSCPRPVDGHLSKLGLDSRITGFLGVVGQKGSATIATAIALSAPTGLTKTLHLLGMPAMLTNNCS